MKHKEYLLTCLSEEAVEVSHAVHKMLRFNAENSAKENIEKLQNEILDFVAMVNELHMYNILDMNILVETQTKEDISKLKNKRECIRKYYIDAHIE